MKKIKIIGIDPSLRNFGIAIGTIDAENNDFDVHDLKLVSTESSNEKRVRKNSQDLERARALFKGVCEVIKKESPTYAFVEVPHGSQSARAMASYGICIGLLASLPIPIIQVTAQENKVKAVKHKTASKEEMILWASGRFPKAPWIKRKLKGEEVMVEKNEHLADAIGAINAGLQTDEWHNIMSLLKTI